MSNEEKKKNLRNNFVPVRLTATELEHLDKVRNNTPRATYIVSCYRDHERLNGTRPR
jgi:hypothetical protein